MVQAILGQIDSCPRRQKRADRVPFGRCESGASAVEFAFLAPIIIGFLIAILEAPAVVFGNMSLSRMSTDIAAAIRNDQERRLNASQIRTIACGATNILIGCSPERLVVQVYPANTAAPSAFANVYSRSSTPGTPDIVKVRYRWSSYLPVSMFALPSPANTPELTAIQAVMPDPLRGPCATTGGVIWC